MKRKTKVYLRLNLLSIFFVAVSFISVTLAWFVYSGLSSMTTEVNVKAAMKVYVEEQETKVSVDVTTTSDNTPKAEKVNIKNSVDYKYISTEDQQKIITSISNYGTLGTLFQTYVIGSLIPNPEPEVPTTETTVNDQVTDSTTQVQTPAVNY